MRESSSTSTIANDCGGFYRSRRDVSTEGRKWLRASDVVVVGGGHNALVCAAYLAEAGLSVTVLEGRDVIGGNTVTEELTLPGWHHDSCSTAHVVLQSNPLIRDDELGLIARYGLKYIVTDPAVVFPLPDGDLLTVHPKLADTAAEFARYSRADADALVTMIEDWNAGQRIAHAYLSAGLPLPDEPWSHSYEELRRRSAWDVIASTFHHPVTRQVMAWMGFATIQPPQRPGTGALPAAIMAGRLAFGWATPVGGSGALPNALAAHITDHGGTVETSAWVRSVMVEDGRCVGVRTDDGREFRAAGPSSQAAISANYAECSAPLRRSPTRPRAAGGRVSLCSQCISRSVPTPATDRRAAPSRRPPGASAAPRACCARSRDCRQGAWRPRTRGC